MLASSLLPFIALSTLAGQVVATRIITVKNKCSYTVWPAVFTNPGVPLFKGKTGWEAKSGSSRSFAVPTGWGGRVWGRRECDFTTDPSSKLPSTCATGGCNGGLQCDRSTGTGVPPTTLAEWTMDDASGQDWYDISIVDGFDIPMTLSNSGGGRTSSCSGDVNPSCPTEAMSVFSKETPDEVIGCRSACAADPSDTASCCSGEHSTPDKCPNSGVKFYDLFKSFCTDGYAYAYDESSASALYKVASNEATRYLVTFCPTK